MSWSGFLTARAHIQNFTDTNSSNLEPHWGYADRIVPCTSDAGTCEYLDVTYHSHDLGILYTGVFWASILAILLLWGVGRRIFPSRRKDELPSPAKTEAQTQQHSIGGAEKVKRAFAAFRRRYLLPDFAPRVFGHVSRLQITILAVLFAYLIILNFIGIVYKTWITPVKGSPGVYNTRTSLGPFADRIGVLAYALTPLSVLLASRESLLSLITGIPYQNFVFLHRWIGHVILLQSFVHTLGWVIVEGRLYQPQPEVWNSFAPQLYIVWGFVALGLLVLLWFFATPWGIRLTGYEFFRKAHYVLAMVYIGALIGHWQQLQCFLIPSILLWFCDRAARLVRSALLHHQWLSSKGKWGFEAAAARVAVWEDEKSGDVVRLDFELAQQPWAVGQHFFLTFPEGSIWQSHPMTPLSLPVEDKAGRVRHSYVIRAKKGETKKVAQIAMKKLAAMGASPIPSRSSTAGDEKSLSKVAVGTPRGAGSDATTSVILSGPYGTDIVNGLAPETNVLCIAGGTGITFVMPVLLDLVRERRVPGRKVQLVWAVRRDADVKWVEQELEEVRNTGCSHGVQVEVFVTREKDHHSSGSSADGSESGCNCNDIGHHHPSNTEVPEARRPHLDEIVRNFVGSVSQGPTVVYASGPGGMIGDLRRVVATCNEAGKVWSGDGRGDVRLICDDRLE